MLTHKDRTACHEKMVLAEMFCKNKANGKNDDPGPDRKFIDFERKLFYNRTAFRPQ